ncbi:aliphatic sulfonate ABC transporter substrate-binding protein [Paenibacillus mucilaginosus]|uniref:Putative aliphatic sulfonates-binding protein n=2 Tax=Paenibacillus mucilaginosus TaxID=61624 RepID=R9UND0_9BACL|nr:aliphatic sulfonate ABC transporter substrate-binding protein [Paenibacillus mucilaginosus]AEI44595.1 aliphatic sulfonates family ABC transporter, periplasmic ligand-binding protein [Paenibacillus mucilaginosus KNP414]AGN70773.1 sulfonate ABC transporter substrate-binding protein [Paenibacillus mucilaginosus K02]MCG7215535.1 aliphatic sulfonate ABC transporter substrate-binding protein [Paenibacillus mucilaginosus]WDM26166.1 aliphatic sulfonate ABC transporter substrate-binding protein [Paen
MTTQTTRKTRWLTALTGILLFSLPLLSACGKTEAVNGAAAAGSGTAVGAAKEKIVVNLGIQGSTNLFSYARDKKIFEEAFAKAGAEVKWHEFASGPPHFEALASGRLDFGSVGGTPVVSAQTGGVDFKAIAVTGDGKKGNAIVLPKGSTIKDIKELRGKKIAVAKGSSAYNFLYRTLEAAGLKDSDVKIIQLQPDEAKPALDTGAIDAWSVWEPYITTAVVQSKASILVSGQELGVVAPGFLVARTQFTEQHPELTVLFLKTYEELRQYYTSHYDEVTDHFVKTKKVDKEIVSTVLKKSEPLLSPITPEFAKAHQDQADFLFNAGAITKKLDTSKVLESKFVEQALKELKEGK